MILRTTQYDGADQLFSSAVSTTARCTSAIRGGGRRNAKPSIKARTSADTRWLPRSERETRANPAAPSAS